MVRYRPDDGKWSVLPQAKLVLELRKKLTQEAYDEQKQALKEFLCGYFSATTCNRKQGNSIAPVGATHHGGKILKVRWGLPGYGKSGGLRLVVVAYCEELRVVIAQAFFRKDDPTDEQISTSVQEL